MKPFYVSFSIYNYRADVDFAFITIRTISKIKCYIADSAEGIDAIKTEGNCSFSTIVSFVIISIPVNKLVVKQTAGFKHVRSFIPMIVLFYLNELSEINFRRKKRKYHFKVRNY